VAAAKAGPFQEHYDALVAKGMRPEMPGVTTAAYSCNKPAMALPSISMASAFLPRSTRTRLIVNNIGDGLSS
jgi:hypothetical protein